VIIKPRGFGWKKDPYDPNERLASARPGLTRIEGRRMDGLAGPVLDQWWWSACVGFTAVELLQMFYAVIGRPITQLSPWHAYRNGRAVDNFHHEDGGAFIRSALWAMQNVGCCPDSAYPFDPTDENAPINERPPDSAENAGIKFADFRTERVTGGPEAVLDQLQIGRPVAMGVNVTSAFVFCNSADTIPAPKPGDVRQGGHAFLLCGFDRHGERIRAKNSWGKDYGDGGYMWLDPDWISDPTTQDVIAITSVKPETE
jgi:C1A family cysteine protease